MGELAERSDITTNPDNGQAIEIMNTDNYINQANCQL